jgi:hypothetical protein
MFKITQKVNGNNNLRTEGAFHIRLSNSWYALVVFFLWLSWSIFYYRLLKLVMVLNLLKHPNLVTLEII